MVAEQVVTDTEPACAATSLTTQRDQRTPEQGGDESADKIVRKLLTSLKPSPENDHLYDKDDADIVEFAACIQREGLLDPLVITRDNYIVSGHRRYAALVLLRWVKVRCRVLPVCRAEMGKDEYVALLRRHNRNRDKSVAEKVREKLVDLNADEAYEALTTQRARSVHAATYNGAVALQIEGSKQRYNISDDKAEHVNRILQIVRDRRAYWPLSVRSVHYPKQRKSPLKLSPITRSVSTSVDGFRDSNERDCT